MGLGLVLGLDIRPGFLSDPWLSDLLRASGPTLGCPTCSVLPFTVRPAPCFLSDPWMSDPASCPTLGYPTRLLVRPLDVRPGPCFWSDPWLSHLLRATLHRPTCSVLLVRPLPVRPATCFLSDPLDVRPATCFLSDPWVSNPASCPTLGCPCFLSDPCLSDLLRASCPTLGCPTCSVLLVRPLDVRHAPRCLSAP